MEELNKLATDLLCRMIGTPSLSGEEDAAADIIEEFLQDRGFRTSRKYNNVRTLIEPDPDLPVILLNSHLDTVKPVEGWTRDPFRASIEDGRIYGLGSNDAGASLVALLACLIYLSGMEDLPYRMVFAASAEEEISGEKGICSILPELGQIDLAMVGEPTGMNMAVSEKGLMVIDCTAGGRSAHVSHGSATNAIYSAMKDIGWIREFRFGKDSQQLGPVQMQVTQIKAGYQHNIVPDRCDFVLDVRSNDQYSNEEVFGIIRDHLGSECRARSFRLNASAIPMDHPVVQRGISMGLECFGSATLSDQALMPFPSVKIGPGDSSRSHTADEFIMMSELHEGISTYIELLKGLKL
jgi:acetylornithine deacetylase